MRETAKDGVSRRGRLYTSLRGVRSGAASYVRPSRQSWFLRWQVRGEERRLHRTRYSPGWASVTGAPVTGTCRRRYSTNMLVWG